jgi:hypothetical protein
MPDQVVAAPPVVAPPVKAADPKPQAAPPAKEPTASDIITRVGQDAPKPLQAIDVPPELKLNRDEFLKDITDPKQRQFFEEKFSAAERGINEKFMRLSDLRKQAEGQQHQPWTPERVQALVSDPSFVAAANAHLKTIAPARSGDAPTGWEGTPDQWAALPEEEQRAFLALDQKASEANRKVDQLLASHGQMVHQQEHERVRTRFQDYDPQAVDAFMQQVIDNRVTGEQLKEFIHKALNFDRYVERSYKLGLADRNGAVSEKVAGATSTTAQLSVSPSDDPTRPKPVEGERTSRFFVRLAEWNRQKAKS